MNIRDAINQFRGAAIEKATCKTAKEDHRLHKVMSQAFQALEQQGAVGRNSFEQLLGDELPEVRCWVAAQMLSEGNVQALPVMEQIRSLGGTLKFGAEMTIREFKAGRLGSPFHKSKSSNQGVQRTSLTPDVGHE